MQIVKRIYIIYERKQSRVVEWSDTDDRLQSALDARFRNSTPENTENIATKQAMMARHIGKYVLLGSLVNKHSFRKGRGNR